MMPTLSACAPRKSTHNSAITVNKSAQTSPSSVSVGRSAASPATESNSGTTSDENTISRDDAISSNWDEIKGYVNGTETVNACSDESGNCYDLDADISDGSITQIHFPNGGSLDFSAEIDNAGDASGTDVNGNGWSFAVDMNSSLVDEAVDEWAKNNSHSVQP